MRCGRIRCDAELTDCQADDVEVLLDFAKLMFLPFNAFGRAGRHVSSVHAAGPVTDLGCHVDAAPCVGTRAPIADGPEVGGQADWQLLLGVDGRSLLGNPAWGHVGCHKPLAPPPLGPPRLEDGLANESGSIGPDTG